MKRQTSRPHQADAQDEFNTLHFVQIPLTPMENEALSAISRQVSRSRPMTNRETLYEVVQCALAEWEHISAAMAKARLNEALGDCPCMIQYRRKLHLRLTAAAKGENTYATETRKE